MATDPMALLEQLRQEQRQPAQEAPASQESLQDPAQLLNDLRQKDPEFKIKTKQEKEEEKGFLTKFVDLLRGEMEVPDATRSVFKSIAGWYLDDKGNMVVEPKDDILEEIKTRQTGAAKMIGQGATELAQGGVQMSFDILEALDIAPEGLTEYYTSLSEEQRKEFNEEFEEEFGSVAKFSTARTLGKTGPLLFLGPLGQGATVKSTIMKSTMLGGLLGGAEFIPEDSDQSRGMNAAKSAGITAGFATTLNALPGMRNWFKGKLKDAFDTDFARQGAKISEKTGVPLKASQLSDDPIVRILEKVAEGTGKGQRAAGNLEAEQIGKTLNYWNTAMKKISSMRGDKGEIAKKIGQTFIRTLGDSSKGTGLLGFRAKQAANNFGAAHKAANGEKVINLNGFKDKALSIAFQWRNSGDVHKRRAAREIVGILRKLRSTGTGESVYKVSPQKIQDMLEVYGGAAKGSGRLLTEKVDAKVQANLGKALFSQLNKDLDAAIKSGAKGANELKIARDNYKVNSEAIDKLTKTGLAKVFNMKDAPATPEGIKKAVLNMQPEEAKNAIQLMSKVDPQITGRIQRLGIEDLLTKAKFRTGASEPIFKAETMLKLDAKEKRQLFNTLYAGQPTKKKMVEDGLEITQRIIQNNLTGGGVSFMTKVQQAAGVAASMDKTFQARLAAELFTPKAIAKYIQTKEGLKALTALEKGKETAVLAAQLLVLKDIYDEETE